MRHPLPLVAALLLLLAADAAVQASQQNLYTFDANGNLTSKTEAGVVWTYVYDTRDQLTQVRRDGMLVEVYEYDHAGRRIRRAGAEGLRRYVWDGDRIVLETDDSGNRVAAYTYAVATPLAYDHHSEGTAFVLLDVLGSPTALVRSDGSLASRYTWDAWGELRVESGVSSTALGFTGYQTDLATGLCYARARFYDPETGRFLSEDPLEGDALTSPSLHRYVYAFDNPTIYVDRDGRCVGDYADSEPCVAIKRAAEAAWKWFKAPFESGSENASEAFEQGVGALAAVEGGLRTERFSSADVEEYLEQGNGGSASAPALRKLATAGERAGAAAEHAGQAALDAYSAAERVQLVAGTAYLAWEGGRFVVKQGARRLSGSVVDEVGRIADGPGSARSGIVTESTHRIGANVGAPWESPTELRPRAGSAEAAARWVDEGGNLRAGRGPGMSEEAYAYQSGATGARSNRLTGRGQAPALDYLGPDGVRLSVKFDGLEGAVLIDRKISVHTGEKTRALARRQSEALRQNGLTGVWELPTEAEAARAQQLLVREGITNIDARVKPN